MTLVLNEIHVLNGFSQTMLVAAADRRITRNGNYDSTRRKLFKIPYLPGTVSYFGLATAYPNGRKQYLSEWLPNFILRNNRLRSLGAFASTLADELNSIVPPDVLLCNPSGFHLSGYDSRGLPDFWYFSNIGGMDRFRYKDLRPSYSTPSSHFLERDARAVFGWDGDTLSTTKNGPWIYRNGDFRAHAYTSELLDLMLDQLMQFPDFKRPQTPGEYGEYIKFKLEFIAYIYKKWARSQIIARPIDVVVFTANDSVVCVGDSEL